MATLNTEPSQALIDISVNAWVQKFVRAQNTVWKMGHIVKLHATWAETFLGPVKCPLQDLSTFYIYTQIIHYYIMLFKQTPNTASSG